MTALLVLSNRTSDLLLKSSRRPYRDVTRSQYIVHKPLVSVLDAQERISHLQPPNCLALHCHDFSPAVLPFSYSFFKALQLLGHHTEAVDFRSKRRVMETVNHTVRLLLSFGIPLEYLQLLGL